jgi:hypothetical protein
LYRDTEGTPERAQTLKRLLQLIDTAITGRQPVPEPTTGKDINMDRLVIVAGTPHQCVSDGKTYRWLPDGASVARAVAAYGLNVQPIEVRESDLGVSVDGLRPGGEPVTPGTSPATGTGLSAEDLNRIAEALSGKVGGTLSAGSYTVSIAPAGPDS